MTDSALLASTKRKVQQFSRLSVVTQLDTELQPTAKGRAALRANHPRGPDIVILSYSQALAWKHSLDRLFPSPCVYVLDEAMGLKDGKGQTDKLVKALTERASRVVAMTATPYENDPLETFSVVQCLHVPGLWPRGTFESAFVDWREEYQMPTSQVVPGRRSDPDLNAETTCEHS